MQNLTELSTESNLRLLAVMREAASEVWIVAVCEPMLKNWAQSTVLSFAKVGPCHSKPDDEPGGKLPDSDPCWFS